MKQSLRFIRFSRLKAVIIMHGSPITRLSIHLHQYLCSLDFNHHTCLFRIFVTHVFLVSLVVELSEFLLLSPLFSLPMTLMCLKKLSQDIITFSLLSTILNIGKLLDVLKNSFALLYFLYYMVFTEPAYA